MRLQCFIDARDIIESSLMVLPSPDAAEDDDGIYYDDYYVQLSINSDRSSPYSIYLNSDSKTAENTNEEIKKKDTTKEKLGDSKTKEKSEKSNINTGTIHFKV